MQNSGLHRLVNFFFGKVVPFSSSTGIVLLIAKQLSFMIPKVVFPVLLENGTSFPKFSFVKRCKPPFYILPKGQSANFRTPYGQSVEFCVISFLGLPGCDPLGTGTFNVPYPLVIPLF
jgi:hypothetical protein